MKTQSPRPSALAGFPMRTRQLARVPLTLAFLGFLVPFSNACGPDATKARAPSSGEVYVPTESKSKAGEEGAASKTLGSQPGVSLVQGLNAAYSVPKGYVFMASVTLLKDPKVTQNRTVKAYVFEAPDGTLSRVDFAATYGSAILKVPFKGAPEGIHTALVTPLFEDGTTGDGVMFEIRHGPSTARAVAPASSTEQDSGSSSGSDTSGSNTTGAAPSESSSRPE